MRVESIALGIALCLAGCGAGERSAPPFVARDSAGVQIVETTVPAWSDSSGWRLSGEPAVEIGSVSGPAGQQLHRAASATRLADGRIVVGNGGTGELRYYDPDGRYLRAAGGPGEGPGEFTGINGLWPYRGDSLAVWDRRLRRVSVFTADGSFGRSDRLEARLNPGVWGTFADGAFLVQELQFERPRSRPVQMPADYFLNAGHGARLDSLGHYPFQTLAPIQRPDGTVGVASEVFGAWTFAAVHGSVYYVGTADEPEIEVRAPDGTLGRLIRWREEPRPVTDADLEAYRRQRIERADSESERRRIRQTLEQSLYASVFPHFDWLEVDRTGNLWARRYQSSADEGPDRWLVFDPDGRMLGEVGVPAELRVLEIGDDYVLGLAQDDLDVEYVRLYRLVKGPG